MATTKLWALVKWEGGLDDKKYTVGIPVEWIKGFDIEEFRSDKFDSSETYVIEWRDKRKEPTGGWPVYDAYVIDVSNRIRVLNNKLSALDGLLSPIKIIQPVSSRESEGQEKIAVQTEPPTTAPKNKKNDYEKQSQGNNSSVCRVNDADGSDSDDTREENQQMPVKTTEKKRKDDEKEYTSTKDYAEAGPSGVQVIKQKKRLKRSEIHDPSQSEEGMNDRDVESEISGCLPLESKRSKKKLYNAANGGTANPVLQQTLTTIQDELKKIRRRQLKKHANDFYSSSSSDDDMIEIGPRGSGIYITEDQWRAAKSSVSYTAMGISLLVSLFPMEVLLRSNLRGGSGKNNRLDENAPKYEGLHKPTLDALYCSQ